MMIIIRIYHNRYTYIFIITMIFPSEILIKIFSYIKSDRDMLSLMLTCKLFYNLIDTDYYYKMKLIPHKIPYIKSHDNIDDINNYKEIYKLYSTGLHSIKNHYESFINISREYLYNQLVDPNAPWVFYLYKSNKPIYPLELFYRYSDNSNGQNISKMEFRIEPDILIAKGVVCDSYVDCKNFFLFKKQTGKPILRNRYLLPFNITEFYDIYSRFCLGEYYYSNSIMFSHDISQILSINEINYERLGLIKILKY